MLITGPTAASLSQQLVTHWHPYCACLTDEERGAGYTRAVGVAGGFKELLSSFKVNGRDATNDLLECDRVELLGGATVHFPKAKHLNDPTSGPLVVITTPKMMVRASMQQVVCVCDDLLIVVN